MSWVKAKDISQWQGNWQDTGEPIVFMKCGGGDAGLYFDSKCTENYSGAVAAGRAPGLYWFIGWQLGAEQEASFFLKAVSPLAENDVYALDIEKAQVPVPSNAVQYVLDMANFMHDNTGAWPLVYMNLSTLNQFDWSPVLKNCGLWLADWAVSPDATIPTHYTYVMQQYNDGPNYDHDAWFGTVEQFKAYGYHKEAPSASTQPTPPVETQPSQPETPPVETPVEPSPVQSTPVQPPVETQPAPSAPETAPAPSKTEIGPPADTTTSPVQELLPKLWQFIIAIIKKLFKKG